MLPRAPGDCARARTRTACASSRSPTRVSPVHDGAYSVADESDAHAARLHRLPRSAEGDAPAPAIAALARARRRGQGPDRRQRAGDAQGVPRGRPRAGDVAAGREIEAHERRRAVDAGRAHHGLRQAARRTQKERIVARAAAPRPHGRLPGRRHQRRAGAARSGRRHLGRHRGRHRQGIRRHHSARKEPDGARRRRARRPEDLRQHHQVHQDDGELQLRQRVQRARAPARSCRSCRCCRSSCSCRTCCTTSRRCRFPFDDMDAEYLQRPRSGTPTTSAGSWCCIGPISSIFDFATFCADVVRVRARTPDAPGAVPVRLVRRRPAVADARSCT